MAMRNDDAENVRMLLVTRLLLQMTFSTDRSTQPAALQTARSLCVAVKTLALPGGGGPGTGAPMGSVTCLCGLLRTWWKMLPDPGTGFIGPETYQRTTSGLKPGPSSCQSLKSSPGSSTSNFLKPFSVWGHTCSMNTFWNGTSFNHIAGEWLLQLGLVENTVALVEPQNGLVLWLNMLITIGLFTAASVKCLSCATWNWPSSFYLCPDTWDLVWKFTLL